MTRLLFLVLASLFAWTSIAQAQQVKLATNYGDIIVEVDAQKAPISAENFLRYVRDGFYDSTIIHRVIDNFVIQGGGFNESFQQKATRGPIENEAEMTPSNRRGTIAMARTSNPDSATSQFFINVVDNTFLDQSPQSAGYAVFGKVISGMGVVDQIRAVDTSTFGPYADVPTSPVVINSATILGAYLQVDIAGDWNAFALSDDAATGNAPSARACELEFDDVGDLSEGECHDLDAVTDTLSAGQLNAQITEFGEVTVAETPPVAGSLADAHMDLGRTVIGRMEAVDQPEPLAERTLEVFVAQGVDYLQSDLGGTWQLFQFGDNVDPGPNAPFWRAGFVTFDANGDITGGEFALSDAPHSPLAIASGSAILDVFGSIISFGDWKTDFPELDERMDAGRSVIAGISRETIAGPGSDDSLRVWVKQGSSYQQSDASGVWHFYLLSDQMPVAEAGDVDNDPKVQKAVLRVDADGRFVGDGFGEDRQTFDLQGRLLVEGNGDTRLEGDFGDAFSFHKLHMDAGKTVIAGVLNETAVPSDRPTLLVAVKSVGAPPKIVFPAAGATLDDTFAELRWVDNGSASNRFQVWVGSEQGGRDLFDSGTLSGKSRSVIATRLPVDGTAVHVQLRYRIGSVWNAANFEYQAADVAEVLAPSIVSPGASLSGSSTTFMWQTNGTPVTRWQLLLGSSVGGNDLFNSGVLPVTNLSTATVLPTDGRTIYARLRYDDKGWKNVDVLFEAADFDFPTLTDPVPGTDLVQGPITFGWALNGHPVQDIELWVGSAPGGKDLADSGGLDAAASSFEVTTLPADGREVFVRLRYKLFGQWAWADYGYTAYEAPLPVLTAPDTEVALSGSDVSFAWDNNGHPVSDAQLLVGTRVGRGDLFSARALGGASSVAVTGLPTDGRIVYVRLRSRIGGTWFNADYTVEAKDDALPVLTAPTPGAALVGTSQLFGWNTYGHPVSDTEVWVGTSFGGSQIIKARKLGGELNQLEVENLPDDGRAVYVRLRTRILGKWVSADYQFSATGAPQPALLTPVPGSTLIGPSVPFTWMLNGLGDVSDIQLRAGSKAGASNYGNSGTLEGTVTGHTFDALPATGEPVYLRLRYRVAGQWKHLDYSFTAADLPLPALDAPTLSGSEETFTWSNNGHAVSDTQLRVGSRKGGADVANVRKLGTDTAVLVEGLPSDGRIVYVRLRSRIGAKWFTEDTEHTAANLALPALTAPNAGAPLSGASETFTWDFNGHAVSDAELWVGTSFGGQQIVRIRELDELVSGEVLVTNLPETGQAIYVRLRTRILGRWESADYQFSAAGAAQPALEAPSPTPGDTLGGAEVTFTWTLNGLADVTDIELRAGSKAGASNYGNSGTLDGAATTHTFDALPADGSTMYVQLRYRVGGTWKNLDYSYTAADEPLPALDAPTLSGSDETLTWSNNGHAVTDAELLIGSRKGKSDLAKIRKLGADTSALVEGLPTDGRSVYVRLRSRIGGKWVTEDTDWTAADLDLPTLSSPTPGEVLTSTSHLFEWDYNGHPVSNAELWVGTSFRGKQVVRARNLGGDTTQLQVDDLPDDARTIYVRLRYQLLGEWLYDDYVVSMDVD